MTIGSRYAKIRLSTYNKVRTTYNYSYGNCNSIPLPSVMESEASSSVLRTVGEDWIGADSPDYRQRIKDRVDSTNLYAKTWIKLNTTIARGHIYYENRQLACGGYKPILIRETEWKRETNADIPAVVPAFDGLVNTMAAQQFIRRARKAISEAQALVSVGELAESVRMVLNARRAVLEKLVAFQKSAIKSTRGIKVAKGRKKAVANAWLEYSFGWAPLIGDSVNLANAAAAVAAGSMRNRRVTGTSERITNHTEDGSGYTWADDNVAGTTARKRSVTIQSCHYFGALRWSSGDVGQFSSQFGLTMDSWIPSIWELIPWSFAIDYFTGIGDFLSSITFPLGKFLYYGRSRKAFVYSELYDQKVTDVDVSNLTQTRQYWATPGKTRAERGFFQRDVPSLIVRAPRLRVPGYKEAYINLGALAALRSRNHT